MQTWLDQVKADAELQTRKSLERRKLEAEVTKNRQWRSKKHRDRLAYIESFVLVEEQISRWWQALPDEQKQRPFTTRELAPQLRGRFQAHPALSAVATALRGLGFVQRRAQSNTGQSIRYWYYSADKK